MQKILYTFLLSFWCMMAIQAQSANSSGNTIVPGEAIVRLQPGENPLVFARAFSQAYGIDLVHNRALLPRRNVHDFSFPPQAAQTLNQLWAHPKVLYAYANRRVEYRSLPNDPNWKDQYHLTKIQADDAWEFTTGGRTPDGEEIVIGIIDEGFDVDHDDLKDNIWVNPNEIPNNGVDDDGNGWIDDVTGWNLSDDTPTHFEATHGTRVFGSAAATGNNNTYGVGVAYDAKVLIMSNPDGFVTDIIFGYGQLADFRRRYNESGGTDGAFIVATNSSFGTVELCTETSFWNDAMEEMGEVGILNVVAATNGNPSVDIDIVGDAPTTCPSDYVLTVTGTDIQDRQVFASGPVSVDVAAPAMEILTTRANNGFDPLQNGNSFAAPQVAGIVALLYGLDCLEFHQIAKDNPAEAALLAKQFIMESVNPIPDLAETTVTGGRVNAFDAVQKMFSFCDGIQPDQPLRITGAFPNPAREQITIRFSLPEPDTYLVQIHNVLGQLVHERDYEVAPFAIDPLVINTRSYNSGTYFLTISNDQHRESFAFQKL